MLWSSPRIVAFSASVNEVFAGCPVRTGSAIVPISSTFPASIAPFVDLVLLCETNIARRQIRVERTLPPSENSCQALFPAGARSRNIALQRSLLFSKHLPFYLARIG